MNWTSLAITLILEALKEAVKNPAKALQLRAAMLKIAATIQVVYGDDESFLDDLAVKVQAETVKTK